MSSSAIVLFQQSLQDFMMKYLQISTEYSQHCHRSMIESRDIHQTLRFLARSFYSIIPITTRGRSSNDDEYQEHDEEEDEKDEEELSGNERDQDDDLGLPESISSPQRAEEIDEEKSSGDDIKIELNGGDDDLELINYWSDLNEDNLISLHSFYHILTSNWNGSVATSISFSALEAFHSIVNHHVILNLEGNSRYVLFLPPLFQLPSLFAVEYLGYPLPFGVVCRLLNEKELKDLLHQESKCYEMLISTSMEQRDLNNLLKVNQRHYFIPLHLTEDSHDRAY